MWLRHTRQLDDLKPARVRAALEGKGGSDDAQAGRKSSMTWYVHHGRKPGSKNLAPSQRLLSVTPPRPMPDTDNAFLRGSPIIMPPVRAGGGPPPMGQPPAPPSPPQPPPKHGHKAPKGGHARGHRKGRHPRLHHPRRHRLRLHHPRLHHPRLHHPRIHHLRRIHHRRRRSA